MDERIPRLDSLYPFRVSLSMMMPFETEESMTAATHKSLPARTLHAPAAILFVAFLATSSSTFAARGTYTVTEIKPHVFVWVADDILNQRGDPEFNRAGTAGFIITNQGVVVINTTNSPFHGRDLLYEIQERTDQPVKYVINTDAGADQMLGNEVFVDLGATIIATTAAKAEMDQYRRDLAQRMAEDFRMRGRMRGIHPSLPNQTFDGETTLQVGGQTIKLVSLGAGSFAGDAVVYLPQTKVLFLGSLYENGYLPRLAASPDLQNWIDALSKVESWDVDTFVPGLGPPGDRQDFEEFRGFLGWLALEDAAPIPKVKLYTEPPLMVTVH